MQQENKRILIVRTDRIGDVLLTLPMAHALKHHIPSAHISMLIRCYTAELVEHDTAVDDVVYYDDGKGLLPVHSLVRALRGRKFDVVFHTYPRFRAALITWLAGIPVRVGTGYRWYSFLFNRRIFEHRKNAERHELEYNLNLLTALGYPANAAPPSPALEVSGAASEKVHSLLRESGIEREDRIVILHPGSGGSAREWSPANFGALGRKLSELRDVRVIVTGGAGEEGVVGKVQSIIGTSAISVVNRLTLGEYAALAKRASLFISNSTGTIHVAAAVGTQVIGLYPHLLPLSAARWGPYTDKKVTFSPANRPMNCAQCTGERGTSCECMDSIPVDQVFEAAAKILSGEHDVHAGSVMDKSLR